MRDGGEGNWVNVNEVWWKTFPRMAQRAARVPDEDSAMRRVPFHAATSRLLIERRWGAEWEELNERSWIRGAESEELISLGRRSGLWGHLEELEGGFKCSVLWMDVWACFFSQSVILFHVIPFFQYLTFQCCLRLLVYWLNTRILHTGFPLEEIVGIGVFPVINQKNWYNSTF